MDAVPLSHVYCELFSHCVLCYYYQLRMVSSSALPHEMLNTPYYIYPPSITVDRRQATGTDFPRSSWSLVPGTCYLVPATWSLDTENITEYIQNTS